MRRLHAKKIDDAAHYAGVWSAEAISHNGLAFDRVRMESLVRDVRPGHRVLDVGAGVFGPAQWITERRLDLAPQVQLTAFDQSYTARDVVARTAPSIGWVLGDAARRLLFRAKEFDVVLCGETIEHMEDPVAFARELVRVGARGAVSTVDHGCPDSRGMEYPEHLWAIDGADLDVLFPGGSHEKVGNYHVFRWWA